MTKLYLISDSRRTTRPKLWQQRLHLWRRNNACVWVCVYGWWRDHQKNSTGDRETTSGRGPRLDHSKGWAKWHSFFVIFFCKGDIGKKRKIHIDFASTCPSVLVRRFPDCLETNTWLTRLLWPLNLTLAKKMYWLLGFVVFLMQTRIEEWFSTLATH